MELVSYGKEILQSIAEYAASYQLGQSALRHLDRGLWVIEKCARWAVPPPLEQDDERPQPELVRPLPWVFFLMMLVVLRVTRESISLVNLVLGKPPLRSDDVVMFIQSKRRYLRTLKYQGTRRSRARTSLATPAPSSWTTSLYSLFELTMCFRRQSPCDNNNTTRLTNNDELVVVKGPTRGREDSSPSSPSASENTMERLIEKMMIDLDVESDEESTYTLTNISTSRTDRSDCTLKTDQDTVYLNDSTPTTKHNGNTSNEDIHFSPNTDIDSSTPEKIKHDLSKDELSKLDLSKNELSEHDLSKNELSKDDLSKAELSKDDLSKHDLSKAELSKDELSIDDLSKDDLSKAELSKDDSSKDSKVENGTHNPNTIEGTNDTQPTCEEQLSDKQVSQNFIRNESKAGTPKKEHKIANGRTVKSVSNKKKGGHRERQQSNEVVQPKALTSNNSF